MRTTMVQRPVTIIRAVHTPHRVTTWLARRIMQMGQSSIISDPWLSLGSFLVTIPLAITRPSMGAAIAWSQVTAIISTLLSRRRLCRMPAPRRYTLTANLRTNCLLIWLSTILRFFTKPLMAWPPELMSRDGRLRSLTPERLRRMPVHLVCRIGFRAAAQGLFTILPHPFPLPFPFETPIRKSKTLFPFRYLSPRSVFSYEETL